MNRTDVPPANPPLPYHSLSARGEGRGEVDTPPANPCPAPPHPRGAPKGNSNAVRHGYYSRNRAESYRRVLAEAGYGGIDLEIVLTMWRQMQINRAPGRGVLKETSISHFLALVRRKYDIGRQDGEALMEAFLLLCFELVFTPSLHKRLVEATALKPGTEN